MYYSEAAGSAARPYPTMPPALHDEVSSVGPRLVISPLVTVAAIDRGRRPALLLLGFAGRIGWYSGQ